MFLKNMIYKNDSHNVPNSPEIIILESRSGGRAIGGKRFLLVLSPVLV